MKISYKQSLKARAFRISGAIATGALLSSFLAPAAFADAVIVGNGAFSSNTISTVSVNTTSVSQTNNTIVGTTVNSTASTGGNSSSFNTGGSSTITTGPATNTTDVTVLGGSNSLTVSGCGCPSTAGTALIAGNGAFSHNKVWSLNVKSVTANQTSNTVVGTSVTSKAKTGHNSSSFNTGPGTSSVTSGGAANGTTVLVVTPTNTMTVTP